MNQVPHYLRHLPSILENLSIPFSPHNPQQSGKSDLPKSLASSRVPKTLQRNNHQLTIVVSRKKKKKYTEHFMQKLLF